jgi:hypothetical protein
VNRSACLVGRLIHRAAAEVWIKNFTVELEDGHFAKVHVGVDLKALIPQVPGVADVTVDMPLGLVERGFRRARQATGQVMGLHDRDGHAVSWRP